MADTYSTAVADMCKAELGFALRTLGVLDYSVGL